MSRRAIVASVLTAVFLGALFHHFLASPGSTARASSRASGKALARADTLNHSGAGTEHFLGEWLTGFEAAQEEFNIAQALAQKAKLENRCKMLLIVLRQYPGEYNRGQAAEKEVAYGHEIANSLGCAYRELSDASEYKDMSARAVQMWLMQQMKWIEDASYTVVVAAGHGSLGYLCGTDWARIDEMNDIERPISTAVGHTRKFYFYQHCLGEGDPERLSDQAPRPPGVQLENTYRFYPTAHGFTAGRTDVDSPYLHVIRDVFQDSPHPTIMHLDSQIAKRFKHRFGQVAQFEKSAGADELWHFY